MRVEKKGASFFPCLRKIRRGRVCWVVTKITNWLVTLDDCELPNAVMVDIIFAGSNKPR